MDNYFLIFKEFQAGRLSKDEFINNFSNYFKYLKETYYFVSLDDEDFKNVFLLILKKYFETSKNAKDFDASFKKFIDKKMNSLIKKRASNGNLSDVNRYALMNLKSTNNTQRAVVLLSNFSEFLYKFYGDNFVNYFAKVINENKIIITLFKNLVNKNSELNINIIPKSYQTEAFLSIINSYCDLKKVKLVDSDDKPDKYHNKDKMPEGLEFMDQFLKYDVLGYEEVVSLVKKYKKGDIDARNTIILHNMKLVARIVNKYFKNYGIPFSDLANYGVIGLIKAIDYYDYTYGNTFSTYARWWIIQQISRSIKENESLIRKPAHLYEINNKIKLEREKSKSISDEEIAKKIGVQTETVKAASLAFADSKSLDESLTNTDDLFFKDIVYDTDINVEDEGIKDAFRVSLSEYILNSNLTELEKASIILRYGLDGKGIKPLRVVSSAFGLTNERIRQLTKAGMHDLYDDPGFKTFSDKSGDEYHKSLMKNLFCILYHYGASAIQDVIDNQKNEDQILMQKVFGKNYSNPINVNNLSINEMYRLNTLFVNIIIELNIKYPGYGRANFRRSITGENKDIYTYFLPCTKEEVDLCISSLNDKQKDILKRKLGNQYDGFKRLNKEETSYFFNTLEIMKRRLKKNYYKTLYEYFKDYSHDEINSCVRTLNKRQFEALKKRFGEDLSSCFEISETDMHYLLSVLNILRNKLEYFRRKYKDSFLKIEDKQK